MSNNKIIENKDNKPFAHYTTSFISTNQIDTAGPILAEILKIVQRIDRRQEDLSNKISRIKNDY